MESSFIQLHIHFCDKLVQRSVLSKSSPLRVDQHVSGVWRRVFVLWDFRDFF